MIIPEKCKNIPLEILDHDILNTYSFIESISLKNMDRIDQNDVFFYSDRKRLYYQQIAYWSAILKHFNFDLVIFPTLPHVPYEFIIYNICRKLNIKTLFFDYTPFGTHIIPIESLEDGPRALNDKYQMILQNKMIDHIENFVSKEILNFFKEKQRGYHEAIPFYMIEQKKVQESNKLLFLLLRFLLIFRKNQTYLHEIGKPFECSDVIGWKYLVKQLKADKKKKKLYKMYKKFAIKPYYSDPYYIVALMYQPEATSSPGAGVYVEQDLIVRMLSSLIPKDQKIYVKEHLSQFNLGMNGQNGRNMLFYYDLASIKNVQLIEAETDTFKLIDNATAVATSTGTIGWEALIRGKPVLAFGYPLYRWCHGVFQVISKEQCIDAIETIQNGFIIDYKKILAYLHAMQCVGINAYITEGYGKQFNISLETSSDNLSNYLYRYISDNWGSK